MKRTLFSPDHEIFRQTVREFFLREQLKIIRRELGEEKDPRVQEMQRLEEVRSPHGISLVDFSTVHCEKSTPDSDRSVRAIPQCHWSCAPMWLRTCTSGG